MAQRLDTPLEPQAPRRRYPWSEWMDGSTWLLVEGEDFTGDAEVFRNRCYAMASRKAMRATVQKDTLEAGRTALKVAFFALEDDAPADPAPPAAAAA